MDARQFIALAEEIAAEDPIYKHGESGQNGECDCIGLVIGAIRRAGGQWKGLHGTNYAARNEMEHLWPIVSSSDLIPGEVVYKAYEPDHREYALPDRYKFSGTYYNGDLRDYYHIGIVYSVYPLRIRHMTTPKAKMDTCIGKWAFHGKLKMIQLGGEEKKMQKVTISGGNIEKPINMREAGSSASKIVAKIPQGSTAELIEGGGAWNRLSWDGKQGYVKSEFVHQDSADKKDDEIFSVSRAELEKAYNIIGDLLGLRG